MMQNRTSVVIAHRLSTVQHADEIMRLIHHCRPVTVAWHRSQGPALLAWLVLGERIAARVVIGADGAIERVVKLIRIALTNGQKISPAMSTISGSTNGSATFQSRPSRRSPGPSSPRCGGDP